MDNAHEELSRAEELEAVSPESGDSRRVVLNTLNSAHETLANDLHDSHTNEKEWLFQAVNEARRESTDTGAETFDVEFDNFATGERISQFEGIPVDGLIDYLRERARALPRNSAERSRYYRYARVMHNNSLPYLDMPFRADTDVYLGRVGHEAYLVSQDSRDTGSAEDNWFLANETLQKRRELIIPSEIRPMEESSESAADEAPVPEPPPPAPIDSEGLPSEGEEADEVPIPEPAPPAPLDDMEVLDSHEPPLSVTTRDEVQHRILVNLLNAQPLLEKKSREAGDEATRALLRSVEGFSPRKIWRTLRIHAAEEGYRQKFIGRAMRAFRENDNVFASVDVVGDEIIDGLANIHKQEEEFRAGMRQVGTGEKIAQQDVRELGDDSVVKRFFVDEIFKAAVRGEIDANNLQEKCRVFVSAHAEEEDIRSIFGTGAKNQLAARAEFFATDLLEKAEMVRADIAAHRYSLEQIDGMVDVRIADIDWAAETEARLTKVDRAVAWLQKRRATSFINPTVVGAAFSLGTFGLLRATSAGGRYTGVAVPVVGAGMGALFAAVRRNYDIKKDMALHRSERAYSKEVPVGAKRREALEKHSYNTLSVDELLNGAPVDESYTSPLGGDRRGLFELMQLDLAGHENEHNRRMIIGKIAEIKSRLDFSAENSMDLVTFQDEFNVMQGRAALIEGVVAARRMLRSGGMDEDLLEADEARTVAEWNSFFTKDKSDQDRAFLKYRVAQSGKAAVVGGVTGLAGGLIGQEALAAAGRHLPGVSEIPIAGALFGKGRTVLEQGASHVPGVGQVGPDGETVHEVRRTVERAPERVPMRVPDAQNAYSIDVFQELYSEGGSIELGDTIQVEVDPATHVVEIFDSHTEQPLLQNSDIQLTPEGHIVGKGEVPSSFQTILEESDFSVEVDSEKVLKPVEIFEKNTPTYEAGMGTGPDAPLTRIPEGTVWIDGKDGAQTLIVADRPDIVLIPDAKIVNGEMTWDTDYSYPEYDSRIGERVNGLFSQIDIEKGEMPEIRTTETRHVLGENGEWERIHRSIDTREWYSYDQPRSQGNELRLHTFKQGDGVVLDMSHMELAYQQGLEPNPIDVPQVIQRGESGFYFSLPEHTKEGVWVPDGADGLWDGKLFLNPDDADPSHVVTLDDGQTFQLGEFSKMVLDEESISRLSEGNIATELYGNEEVFALGRGGERGFIEAGRITRQNNQDVMQAFATIRGEAPIPETIEVPVTTPGKPMPVVNFQEPLVEEVPSTTERFEITPPDAIPPEPVEPIPEEIVTEMTEKQEAPPVIPTPFVPRYPLESMPLPIEVITIYGYGSYSGEGLGWVKRSEYEKRRSRTLNTNPYAELDESLEIADYLSRVEPSYRSELEELNQKIGTPMSPHARAVITIPAFGEEKIIRKTLEHFLNQKGADGNPIDPNLFEIIIFENDTETRPKDKTEEEILRFRAAHPELHVHYAFKRWTEEDIANKVNTVGNGRRYNCDLALLRSSERPSQDGELIIINNDADLEGISSTYIADVIRIFDDTENLDAVVGKRNLPDWALVKPNIRAGQRLWETFDSVMRHTGGHKEEDPGTGMKPNERQKGWPGLIGENSAMKASIYAAVGGYGPNANLAEDQNLGDMMRVARNFDDERFEFINRLQTVKNPRRYLAYMVAGKPLIDMYNDYHENKDIRDLDNEALLRKIPDLFNRNRFELDADGVYQKKNDYIHLGGDNFELRFKKVMDIMGVEYEIKDGHVKISDTSRLERGLGRY